MLLQVKAADVMEANEFYQKQYNEVLQELDKLKQGIAEHSDCQKDNPECWAFVADVNGLIVELQELNKYWSKTYTH